MTGIPTATVAELNEEYIARMEDVLAIYEKPLSTSRPVVCMDEKPVVLHEDTRPRHRCGRDRLRGATTNTSAAAPPTSSAASSPRRDGTSPRSRRRARRPSSPTICWRSPASYSEADTIHLVMDNLSTHTRKALVDRFGEKLGAWLWQRFTVHYTPKHGSWLNQAEIEISLFSRQCLGKRRIGKLASLRSQARAWNRRVNRDQITIQWKFTRKQARRKLHYTITRSQN